MFPLFKVFHLRGLKLHGKGETITGDDCMSGTKVTVNTNVKADRGVLVMADAVVARDVPEFTVGGGIPAKFVKERQ